MELTFEKIDSGFICHVNGKIDSFTAKEFEEKLMAALEESTRKIVLDCTEMTYISSAGLRVFLVTLKKMRAVSGILAVAGLKDFIKEVFDISGFTPLFVLTGTVEEALAK